MYLWLERDQVIAHARTVLKDERDAEMEYTLVVAVANPDHVDQIMRTATDLARGKGGEILVVSVIHKPVTSPFLLFSREYIEAAFDGGRPQLLDRAASFTDAVPIRRHLLVGTDVSEAILTATDEADADAVLLGWQDRPRPSDIVLGTAVDPVIRRAPCDVFVERIGTTANGLESVLVPTVGGPHAEPVADLASAVAAANDAIVTVVSYVSPDADADADEVAARERVESTVELLAGVSVDSRVRTADDIPSAIVRAAVNHDLVVLGATRERSLRRRIVGSVAETVSRRADPPVVIAKRGRRPSLLPRAARWLSRSNALP